MMPSQNESPNGTVFTLLYNELCVKICQSCQKRAAFYLFLSPFKGGVDCRGPSRPSYHLVYSKAHQVFSFLLIHHRSPASQLLREVLGAVTEPKGNDSLDGMARCKLSNSDLINLYVIVLQIVLAKKTVWVKLVSGHFTLSFSF